MERTGRLSTPRKLRAQRGLLARLALLGVVLLLGSQLLKLQVVDVEQYAIIARTNRLRPLPVPAPRGTIYDRTGQVVAENTVGYQVLLMPGPRDSMRAQIERLRPVLGLNEAQIARAWYRFQQAPHLPMPVLTDAEPEAVARLEERRFMHPGVLVETYPKRHYPAGDIIAHLIGYVSEINREELGMPDFQGYEQGQLIGKSGLEREYELRLGGEPGMRYLEIDARGRIRRWLPENLGVPAIPGEDLQLYLDLDLQRYIDGIFPKGFRGGFVAIDPQTGGVLAYYSNPTYDPNEFVGGIPTTLWDSLRADAGNPLLDRAGGSRQPPASTWKLPVAAMALEEGVIRPEEVMPIACTGGMSYGGRYARCWEPAGHGRVDLIRGIMHSCDVYFYQVGIRLGLQRYLEVGTRLGFGTRTGIDLPTELSNVFPSGVQWLEERYGYRPPENHIMSLSIGQGEVTMTPLKMAVLYSAFARPDGKALQPRLADNGEEPPVTIDLGISGVTIDWLRRGMRRVVAPGGSAALSRLRNWDFMGKTGTAQVCALNNPRCTTKDHAWFVGMAGPIGKHPEIVAALFLEEGEHGYTASGVVANAVNFYLDRKYGRPFDPYPTPRERSPRGLPVDWAWYGSPVVDPPWPDSAATR